MLTNDLMDLKFWTCFPEVRGFEIWTWSVDLKFGHASQRSDGLESWTCFPEVRGFEFGHASQRSDGLKFGRASQRSNGLESLTCFPEVQWFGILDMLPRGPWI